LALNLERDSGGYLVRYEAAPKRPDLTEFGGSGTTAFGGFIREEYLSELTGQKAAEVYDIMRRSDAQVRMTLRAIKLPILQAEWHCEPSKDDEEKGQEIAQFCERVLLQGGSGTWRETLNHALLMLDFGFSPMEKVWEIRDRPEVLKGTSAPEKVTWLRKLAPRLPRSVYRWVGLDKEGASLTGIEQQLRMGGFRTVTIPIEKLVIFTLDKEGDNWEGISLLRSAYKHWWVKEMLEKIDAGGHERSAMGVPVATVAEGPNTTDPEKWAKLKSELTSILSHVQANEKSFFIETPGITFRLEVPGGGSGSRNQGVLESINYHNRMIAANILGQFMELGNTQSGSRAVASEQRGPFDLQLLAVAASVGETIERFCLRELVDYNFGPRPGYPTLAPRDITETSQEPLARILKDLIVAGTIIPDEKLEEWLRQVNDLPPADVNSRRQLPTQNVSEPTMPPEETELCHSQHAHSYQQEPSTFWREPTDKERFVAFAQIKYDLDQAKTVFLSDVGETANEIAEELVQDAVRLVGEGDIDRLLALKPAKVQKLASRIRGELSPLVAYGRQTVTEERERATAGKPAPIIAERQTGIRGYASKWKKRTSQGILTWQQVKAQRRAEAIAEALDAAITDEGLRLIRAGVDEEAALAALQDIATKTSERSVLYAAGLLVSEAFSMGRGAQIQEEVESGGVVKGIYSALLDDAVCEQCAAMDGQEFSPDDPDFDKYAEGNPDCYGGDRCRCLLVLDYGTAEPAVKDWKPGDNPAVVMPGFDPLGTSD
jgi:hypothetical protein